MATIQTIGVGTVPNDGTGDPLRDAMVKTNSNFQNLNNQTNTSTNQIANMRMFSDTVSSGNQAFTIPDGGFSDATYEYTFNAYDSNGFEIVGVRRVSQTATTITLNMPQAGTVTITARKL